MNTPIPTAELEIFKKLPNIKVVFDVGARTDADYLDIKPNIALHAFEPNPESIMQLAEKVSGRNNIFLNMFGLGDIVGRFGYVFGLQAFDGGEASPREGGPIESSGGFSVNTLDWYIEKMEVKKIDFLKIDTEGFDYRVLLGGPKAVAMTRFIQYEHWDNKQEFHDLLGKDFHMEYIGYRNVLCMNRKLVPPKTRVRIVKFIQDNKFGELV